MTNEQRDERRHRAADITNMLALASNCTIRNMQMVFAKTP